MSRNEKGRLAMEENSGKRGETILILDGMVLDITRWLPEHPGGSAIIPEEGLNIDCAVFFELYHASRQSFLYLKEFYIGELSEQDREKLESLSLSDKRPSQPFLEQLGRVTPWRLTKDDLITCQAYKSF